MRFITFLYLFVILFHFSLLVDQVEEAKPENDTLNEEENIKETGNGYMCRDKLEEYNKKFSIIDSDVLTDSNVNEVLGKNQVTLLYIHSACTQESHDFIPTLKFIVDYYKQKNDPNSPKIATLDISDDKNNWNNQYNYRSIFYPIILLKIKGTRGFITHFGYNTAHSIITFLTKSTNKDIIPIDNKNILDQMLNPKLTYLSIFAFNHKYMKKFEELSNGLNYVLFGDCTDKKICEEKFDESIYKYSDFALIKMTHIESDFEPCPDDKRILEDGRKPEIIPYNYTNFQEFKEFIYLNAIPKIFNFTGFNKDVQHSSLVNTIVYVRGKKEEKTNLEISKILRKALNLDKNRLKIGGILDPINSKNEESLMDTFRLEEEDYTVYGNVIIEAFEENETKIYRINEHQIYKDKGITEENILKFVSEFNKGALNPQLKSENRPQNHPKENLRMVVAKTFDEEITNNNDIAMVLCLLSMNLTNLVQHEKMIDLLTTKLDALDSNLTFGFLDVGLNYMKDIPKFDPAKTPYYRYYYKNKSEGYDDFKGNYSNIEEIEEWIAINYGKENGEGYDEMVRAYIQDVNRQMKEEEEEKRRKDEEFERDVEAGNVTSFEMVLGDGSTEAINVTQRRIQRILEKKMEAEKRKQMEKNETKREDEKDKKETDL